jgi:hypothetical protein
VTLPGPEVDPRAWERSRLRPARLVLAVGLAVSLVGAVVVGLLGASGAGSLAATFVGAAVTVAVAGLTTLVGALRDELRADPVARRRVAIGVGLLLLSPVLLILAAGAAGAA